MNELSLTLDWRGLRFRLLGLLPLAFFAVRLIDYVHWNTPGHIWWSCHLANLMLALGMFCGWGLLIRVATLWLILGIPPWVLDMATTGIIWPVSLISHLGGAVLGLVAMYFVRARRGSWLYALLWFIFLQQLSRWITPPEFNVNAAFHAYGPFKAWFDNYWTYWLANTALTAALLWGLEFCLLKLFPLRRGKTEMWR